MLFFVIFVFMLQEIINTCVIYCFNKQDYDFYDLKYRNSSIKIINTDLNKDYIKKLKETIKIPSIIIGWDNVKKIFPNQNVLEVEISENLFWCQSCISLLDNSQKENIECEDLIKNINKKFLPNKNNFKNYDYLLDGDIEFFLIKNNLFNENKRIYLFFNKQALYLYNETNVCINLESLKQNNIDFKIFLTEFINRNYKNIILFSFENASKYINIENLNNEILTFENIIWNKYAFEINESEFKNFFSEINDIKKYIPFLMSVVLQFENEDYNFINEEELISSVKQFKKDIITNWLSKKEIFFDSDFKTDKFELQEHNKLKYKRVKYSNKRTITGRINCVDGHFNPQIIPKDSEIRKHIVSRYKNGKIVLIDFVSFETKIALLLSNNFEFIEKFKESDLHEETAKIIFNKEILSAEERKLGKDINHALIYGGGNNKLKEILEKINNNNLDSTIEKIKFFLSPILDKQEDVKNIFKEFGYLINTFGTIVRSNKSWGVFSNYISSIATDIVILKLFEIKEFIKNRNIEFVFQNHDSFILDIHPDEIKNLNEILEFISKIKNIKFPVDCKIGNNFQNLEYFKNNL